MKTMSPTPQRRSRLVGAAKIITVNAAILLGMLLPVELAFGNWLRPLALSDLRRFSIPVDVTFHFDTSALYEGGPRNPITSSRDRWGLRGSHGSLGAVGVLTVGGSTTEQRYLDDLATWQAVAERDLAARGHALVFANAGVDGQSTIGHAFNFDYWFPLLPELRPRYIVFYVGVNDVIQRSDRANYDESLDGGSWRVRSATYQLWRVIRGNWQARGAGVTHGRMAPQAAEAFTQEGMLPVHERDALALRVSSQFVKRIEGLRRRTQALGAVPVFVTQTAFAWSGAQAEIRGLRGTLQIHEQVMNYADVSALHRSLNSALLDYCSAERQVCFALADEVHFDAADYYDFLHNTPRGAEKIGRYLAERLDALSAKRQQRQ